MFPRIAFALSLAVLAGCQSSYVDRLDRQLAEMVHQQHASTLAGIEGDAHPLPDRPGDADPGDTAYQRQPATHSPAREELPAVADTRPARSSLSDPSVVITPGGQARLMDLPASLSYAVAHSRDYRSRKEELFLTAIALLSERHLWGPRFFNDTEAAFVGTPEAGDHDHALELVNQLRLTQRLPYGGEVSARALVSFVEQIRTGAGSTAEDSQTAEVGVGATIPLLRGAGEVAREDLIQAERDMVYATRQFERYRREFFVEIATRYFDLMLQQAQIRNLEAQVANLDLLGQRFKALADAGREPYFKVQESLARFLFARNNLLSARESYASSRDAFKILIGMPVAEVIDIEPQEVVVPTPMLEMISSVQTALALRLDLQTLANRVDDSKRAVAVAKNNLQPDLDVFADVSVPTNPDRKYGGMSLDAGTGAYAAGFRFGAPLDRKLEALSYRRSLVELERTRRTYDLQRDQVALQVRRTIRAIEQARASLDLQQQNVELAERRSLGVKLRERTLTPRDVIDAQDDLLEARNRRDAAVRDLRVNILQYLLNTEQLRVDPQGRWLPPAKLAPVAPSPVGTVPASPPSPASVGGDTMNPQPAPAPAVEPPSQQP